MNIIIKYKSYIYCGIVIGIVWGGCWVWSSQSRSSAEKIVFSNSAHPQVQRQVLAWVKSQYKAPETQLSDIFIFRAHLNSDKSLDVIASIHSTYFSGSHGNLILFFIVDSRGNFQQVLTITAYPGVLLLPATHHGYRDIAFLQFETIGGYHQEGRHIWAFTGKVYRYVGRFPLQTKDWEVLNDEE